MDGAVFSSGVEPNALQSFPNCRSADDQEHRPWRGPGEPGSEQS